MGSATSRSRSSLLAPTITPKPSLARARAVAAPIPLDAPVTTATPRSAIALSLSGTLGGMDGATEARAERALSIRDHLDRLMPPGGRARRLLGWGVVAWTFIG